MAVIGITFATFSGQSRISARNFAQSVNQPQRDELMDYALEQLIGDTADIRSAIRGHSMARDMYGNDGNFNGYLASRPDGAYMPPGNDPFFYITNVTAGTGTLYNLTTNIPAGDSAFYGYNFTRWILRVTYTGALATGTPTPTGTVNQTFEVLADTSPNGYRRLHGQHPRHRRDNAPCTTRPSRPLTPRRYYTQLPAMYLVQAATNGTNWAPRPVHPRRPLAARLQRPGHDHQRRARQLPVQRPEPELDGHGRGLRRVRPGELVPGHPERRWLGDDSVVPPPGGSSGTTSTPRPSTTGGSTTDGPNELRTWADSASRILRPVAADGHDAATFPDLIPDATTGKINYDVDNDGDGITDSVWLDLGYPARRDAGASSTSRCSPSWSSA